MKKGIRKGFFLHCHLINLTKREIPVKLHMTVGILLAAASAFLQAPRDLRSPRIAARIASPLATVDVTFDVRRASNDEDWAAAGLLNECFGGNKLFYYSSLRAPALNSNVFFKPIDEPVIAVAVTRETNELCGAAQLMRVNLRDAVGIGSDWGPKQSGTVAYVQSVAVAEPARRRGVAQKLMAFCESSAQSWQGNMAVGETWLAVAESNEAALALYEGLGYERLTVQMGNVLMRKRLTCVADSSGAVEVGAPPPPPADANALLGARGGLGLAPLMINLGVQSMYIGIAAFGVTFLLSPFGGPDVASLAGLAPSAAAAPSVVETIVSVPFVQAALGLAVAFAELKRQGVGGPSSPSGGPLTYSRAQAAQMRPLYEISAGEASLPLAAAGIGLWQLSIALAEELYYRGFVQSAVALLLSSLVSAIAGGGEAASGAGVTAGLAVSELVALVVSAGLFGAVHMEFVAPADAARGNGDETRADWFKATAAYGVLYSALFLATGHRVIAPTCAHAGMNIGLCLRDWSKMRQTPQATLEATFAKEDDGDEA